jgi:hypothetical protein
VAKSRNYLPIIIAGVLLMQAGCVFQSAKDPARQTPTAPARVEIKQVDDSIEISWTRVPGAVRYTVFWGTESRDYKGLASSNSCSLILKGLNKGETYRFAVTSWNQVGESPYSEEKTASVEDPDSSSHLAKINGARSAKPSKQDLN